MIGPGHGGPRRPSRPRRSGRVTPSSTSPLPPSQASSPSPVPVVAVKRILSKSSVLPAPSDAPKPPAHQTAILAPRRVLQSKPHHQGGPLSIIDNLLRLHRNIETVLSNDQTCRRSFGVVGGDGVGKSTLMSALASALSSPLSGLFATQTDHSLANCIAATSGIDAIFTPNSIFVDSQPLNSISSIAGLMSSAAPLSSVYKSSVHAVTIQSIEISMLMISMCGVVLVMQDTFASDATLQTVATAAMIMRASGGDAQFRARIVFVYNKVGEENFTSDSWLKTQLYLRDSLDPYSFPSCSRPLYNDLLVHDRRNALDLFFIPHQSSTQAYTICVQELCSKLSDLAPNSSNAPYSHATWFRNCCRTWDEIRGSRVIAAYNKVLASQQIQ